MDQGSNVQMLTVSGVGTRLALSTRQVWRLLAAGKLPAPVRIGRSVRFRVCDVDDWVRLGCPDRHEFERRQAAHLQGRGGAS